MVVQLLFCQKIIVTNMKSYTNARGYHLAITSLYILAMMSMFTFVDVPTGHNTIVATSLYQKCKCRNFVQDSFHQVGCWQDYTYRIVYMKQQMIPLVVVKAIQITPDENPLITMLPNYKAT